jgi:hypothetical protein
MIDLAMINQKDIASIPWEIKHLIHIVSQSRDHLAPKIKQLNLLAIHPHIQTGTPDM